MKLLFSFFWVLALMFCAPQSFAHRGVADEIDQCRIKVGFEKIHLTAYTPEISKNRGYCQFIPNVGVTNLVFDYEGQKLRNVSLEFEVTKEPEGTRVFYRPPEKIKSGTVNASMDLSTYGAGDYLVHITIVYKGERLDSHLPLYVGVGESNIRWGMYVSFVLFLLFIMFVVKKSRENKKRLQ